MSEDPDLRLNTLADCRIAIAARNDTIASLRADLAEKERRIEALEAEIQAWRDARDEGVYL